MIGSSTNLLVSGSVYSTIGKEIGFFDFTKQGMILALVGFIYATFLLPIILKIFNKKDMARDNYRIMIIEDDLLLLLVEERLVKRLGYQVVGTASDGVVALSMIRKVKPDILLVDINIKGKLNGVDIIENLMLDGEHIPVIYLTGEQDPELVNRAKNEVCVDFLTKPVTSDVLKESLEKAVSYLNIPGVSAA